MSKKIVVDLKIGNYVLTIKDLMCLLHLMKLYGEDISGRSQLGGSEIHRYRMAKLVPFANAGMGFAEVFRCYAIERDKYVVIGAFWHKITSRG